MKARFALTIVEKLIFKCNDELFMSYEQSKAEGTPKSKMMFRGQCPAFCSRSSGEFTAGILTNTKQ